MALAEDGDRRVQVVVAMRADFYGHCAAYDGLARLVGANQVLVGPMRRDELRRAIVEPARRVGLRVEPSLTDALIVDVLDEPGGLPLLSAALLEQWRERDGHVMRRAAYERTGGVRGAVGRLAEATYARLSEPERIAAKRILVRLADAGDEGASFVRRRVPLDELDPERDGQTLAALEVLVDSRLVTADEGTVEVAHEALLREWPRLRAWLEEDAEGRRLHQHLIHAARDWDTAGRDPGELYRGARLAAALDWSAAHDGYLNALERDFLDESRAGAEQEAERQQRTNRRLRALLAGGAGLLVLALVAGVVALNQRGDARDAALSADAQRLGAEALTQERFDSALLLARTGVALDETPATQGNLLSVLMRTPAALGIVDSDRRLLAGAVSPDGRLMATGDDRGKVTVYEAATREPLGKPYVIRGGDHPAPPLLARRQHALGRLTRSHGPRAERGGRPDRSAHAQAQAAHRPSGVPRARSIRGRERRVPCGHPRCGRCADPWRVPGCASIPALSRGREDGRRRKPVEGRQQKRAAAFGACRWRADLPHQRR